MGGARGLTAQLLTAGGEFHPALRTSRPKWTAKMGIGGELPKGKISSPKGGKGFGFRYGSLHGSMRLKGEA